MDPVLIDLGLRWLHFAAAIVWLGHNYANVVQRPRYAPLAFDGPGGMLEVELETRMRREHGVFRYASIVTWTAGFLLLWRKGIAVEAFTLQGHYAVIGLGAWIGTIMMLNVWLVLWPHQKKVLGLVHAEPAERTRCARITWLSSRTNTMLSIPLLVLMAAGAHGGLW